MVIFHSFWYVYQRVMVKFHVITILVLLVWVNYNIL